MVMCISRVGKIVDIQGNRARIEFFDGRTSDQVDISMLMPKTGAFVEVFGNLALSELTNAEAKRRLAAWNELRKHVIAREGDIIRESGKRKKE
jgi:hydrogenase maturation factor